MVERPKPPVEQKVQAMDTLDKKMQSTLEREDLPTDERLKLYDQALYRYRKLYDDYRPTPKTVKVEPSMAVQEESIQKQGESELEKEVIDSVPKSLKGKAELLL